MLYRSLLAGLVVADISTEHIEKIRGRQEVVGSERLNIHTSLLT